MNTIINPVTVIAAALKGVQYAADWRRITSQHSQEEISQAWQTLSPYEQSRITKLVNEDRKPSPKQLAALLADTDTYEELTEIKADFGHEACREAWNLLKPEVRDRLSTLCPNQKKQSSKKKPSAKTKPSNNTLWEKTAAIAELEEAIASVDDEDIDEETKEAKRQELFEQWLSASEDWEAKLDSCGYAAWCLEQEAEAIKGMRGKRSMPKAYRLKERQEQKRKQAERLRNYMLMAMSRRDKTKLRGTCCTIHQQKQTPIHPTCDPCDLPEDYQKKTIGVKLRELQRDYKAAKAAGEVFEWAYEGEPQTHLVIRMK